MRSTPHNQKINISLVGESDLKELSILFKKIVSNLIYYNDLAKVNEINKYSENHLKSLVLDENYSLIVARRDDKIIGFVIAHFDDYTIWLDWIIIDEYYQRTGVGGLLLSALEVYAKERSCHKIWCDCLRSNLPSKRFLTKNGYRVICDLDHHWYGQDFNILEKTI